MTDVQLKLTIKEILNMKRAPRNLDVIHYFLYVIRKDIDRSDRYLREHYIDETEDFMERLLLISIDDLRRMLSNETPSFEEIKNNYTFISTNILKNIFGLSSKDYKKYFNMFVEEFVNDGYYSYTFKEARAISRWNKSALQFYDRTTDYKIPHTFFMKLGSNKEVTYNYIT
tara:strand:+ start:734 stop:1246 length:513 start_codon:yes stop_codon:yes gene_type:complete